MLWLERPTRGEASCGTATAPEGIGTYAHSGAAERRDRQDAVAATVALLHHLEQRWTEEEKLGSDLVVTCGEFFTDPMMHGPSKISDETRFVIDLRNLSAGTNGADGRCD